MIMMKLQIVGSGCPKCRKLAAQTEAAARELGIEYEIEKVTDVNEMTRLGVLLTPALAVDGEVRLAGKVPGVAALKEILAR
jgi:small redox-active disulfide protein 2